MKLTGIGGGHIDRRGQVSGNYIAAASNPGTMVEDIGGGTLNALRNAARLGVSCSLVSVRGGDGAGEQVAQAVAQSGIADLSATFLDRTTPSYTAFLDRHGDLIAGFADMGLYDLAFPKQLRRSSIRQAIHTHDAVLCDANVPATGLERIGALADDKPVFGIAVSPAKVVRFNNILPRLQLLFMNRNEAAALAGQTGLSLFDTVGALRDKGLKGGVITAGGDPLTVFDDASMFVIEPPAPRKIVDVTGAGDALAGVTIAALLNGEPLTEAIRKGVAASLLAIECAKAVADIDGATLAARLELVPQARTVA